MPLRLPIILLKFCQPLPIDAQQFIYKWNFEYSQRSELKHVFNIDFNQCRSLTQLKEVMQVGRLTFTYVDGVEQQKNILCAAT
jgi:hypothetical protein